MDAVVAFDAQVLKLLVVALVGDLGLEEVDQFRFLDKTESVLEAVVNDAAQPLVDNLVITKHGVVRDDFVPHSEQITLCQLRVRVHRNIMDQFQAGVQLQVVGKKVNHCVFRELRHFGCLIFFGNGFD